MKPHLLLCLLLVIMASPASAFREPAPPQMTRFNARCPAPELCPLLDRAYRSCRAGRKQSVCSVFVDIFARLAENYDCQRTVDRTEENIYIVPAFWMCHDDKSWGYLELLSKLPYRDARAFFASPAFRSMLQGEQAAAYIDQSFLVQEEMAYDR